MYVQRTCRRNLEDVDREGGMGSDKEAAEEEGKEKKVICRVKRIWPGQE